MHQQFTHYGCHNSFFWPECAFMALLRLWCDSTVSKACSPLLWSGSVYSKSETSTFRFCQPIDDLIRTFYTENNSFNHLFSPWTVVVQWSNRARRKKQIEINTLSKWMSISTQMPPVRIISSCGRTVFSTASILNIFCFVLFLFFGPPLPWD